MAVSSEALYVKHSTPRIQAKFDGNLLIILKIYLTLNKSIHRTQKFLNICVKTQNNNTQINLLLTFGFLFAHYFFFLYALRTILQMSRHV